MISRFRAREEHNPGLREGEGQDREAGRQSDKVRKLRRKDGTSENPHAQRNQRQNGTSGTPVVGRTAGGSERGWEVQRWGTGAFRQSHRNEAKDGRKNKLTSAPVQASQPNPEDVPVSS